MAPNVSLFLVRDNDRSDEKKWGKSWLSVSQGTKDEILRVELLTSNDFLSFSHIYFHMWPREYNRYNPYENLHWDGILSSDHEIMQCYRSFKWHTAVKYPTSDLIFLSIHTIFEAGRHYFRALSCYLFQKRYCTGLALRNVIYLQCFT